MRRASRTFSSMSPRKSTVHLVRWGGGTRDNDETDVRDVAEDYYDSNDADTFYSTIWGGEDLHIGLYDETSEIREASNATIERMVEQLPALNADTRLLDLGAGYGGAMRKLVERTGCSATCLNISETQNDTNRYRNRRAGVADRIKVVHGVFERTSRRRTPATTCCGARMPSFIPTSARPCCRRPGAFSSPEATSSSPTRCRRTTCPKACLQPVYDRLNLTSLGSFRFYREAARSLGFEILAQEDLTGQLRTHYARVREELLANYDALRANEASAEYLDKMAVGLENWVKAADAGHLAWGIQLFRKPE